MITGAEAAIFFPTGAEGAVIPPTGTEHHAAHGFFGAAEVLQDESDPEMLGPEDLDDDPPWGGASAWS